MCTSHGLMISSSLEIWEYLASSPHFELGIPHQAMVWAILGVSLGFFFFFLVSLGTVYLFAQLLFLKIKASIVSFLQWRLLTTYAFIPHIWWCDVLITFHFSTEEINLDSSLLSLLTPELHHAYSVVLLSGPYLCVHLHLTVLPAQLASFRQKRAKGDGAGAAKKTQKRKGQTVSQIHNATQDCHIEPTLCSASDTELDKKTNHEVHHILRLSVMHL